MTALCFASARVWSASITKGTRVFKYADCAEQQGLPRIAGCCATNVDGAGTVWIKYYMDFPLVRLRNCKTERVWKLGRLGACSLYVEKR